MPEESQAISGETPNRKPWVAGRSQCPGHDGLGIVTLLCRARARGARAQPMS
jgi:hypothetical protein